MLLKKIWVLVFSFMYLVLVDVMDNSKKLEIEKTNDLSIGSTETKYIKLDTKTQIFFNNIQLFIYFKRENFCFLVAPVKVYKKVVKFSFKRQKIFWVLVFSFMYLVLVHAMD